MSDIEANTKDMVVNKTGSLNKLSISNINSCDKCLEVEALRVLNEGANQAWGRRVKRRLSHKNFS